MSKTIELLEQRQLRKDRPRFKAGDTVRVHFQVIEGQRRRIQVFEGIVIKRQGAGVRETFTVRKQSFGVGGVLLDYAELRDHRVRPLARLNDSKQLSPERREELFRAVVSCAQRIAVRVISHGEIDRSGLHRSNLAGLRSVLWELSPPAEA